MRGGVRGEVRPEGLRRLPKPPPGGELTALTAAAVRDAQAAAPWMPTTIEGFLAAWHAGHAGAARRGAA